MRLESKTRICALSLDLSVLPADTPNIFLSDHRPVSTSSHPVPLSLAFLCGQHLFSACVVQLSPGPAGPRAQKNHSAGQSEQGADPSAAIRET